jgi:galactonate dehydratase
MKIVRSNVYRIPVSPWGEWIFLCLEDSDGHVGWGEASNSGNDASAVGEIERQLGRLAGNSKDALALAHHLAAGAPADKPRRTAWSAIEHAMVELAARQRDISVAKLLCGDAAPAASMPVYANINRMCADRTPEMVQAAARAAVAGGLKRLKFAPFDEVTPERLTRDGEGVATAGLERLQALRDAVGPEIELMIDCHWRFTPDFTAFLAGHAKDLGITWIEDPMPEFDPAVMDRLRGDSGARIAGGEAMLTYEDLEALAVTGAVDVLIADVKFVGGVTALNRICRMTGEHGVEFAPHNPSGPVSTAASVHVAAANPNASVVEYAFGEIGWRADVCPEERLVDGAIAVTGPGYGVSILPDAAGDPIKGERPKMPSV